MREQLRKEIPKGRCFFCNSVFSKAAMTKHITSCKAKATSEAALQKSRRSSKNNKSFHILVEGRYLPEYWMHLEVKAKATLDDLDEFLRDIWLECCGHMSAFTIGGRTFISGPERESGEEGFDIELDKLLTPKITFYHEYDFGTTTDLTLKVLSEREDSTSEWPVQLLARNEAPQINCDICGKPATMVCTQCIEEGGWLCSECAEEHECGEDMLLPVTNSPRVGVCGYTGNGDDEEDDDLDWEDEDDEGFFDDEDDDYGENGEDDDDLFADDLMFDEEDEEDLFEDDEEE